MKTDMTAKTMFENVVVEPPWLEILDIEEHERRRLSLELQEKVGFNLSLLKAMSLTLAETPFPDHNQLRQEVRRIGAHLDRCLESLQGIVRGLESPQLAEGELPEAVSALCRETEDRLGVPVVLRASGLNRLSPTADRALSLTIFRILQEALLNIEQHAGASAVEVRLVAAGSSVILTIEDNGRGFDSRAFAEGTGKKRCFGLIGMRKRVLSLGGTIDIGAAGMRGTRIGAEFPWREQP